MYPPGVTLSICSWRMDGWTSRRRSRPSFVLTEIFSVCVVFLLHQLKLCRTSLCLVLASSYPSLPLRLQKYRRVFFKLWVASSLLEHLSVTRIAVFSSQAEGINVSIRFQTRKTFANTSWEEGETYRGQDDEEGGSERDFWIQVKVPQTIYNSPVGLWS